MLGRDSRLDIVRGVGGALGLGIVGAAAPYVLMGGFTVVRWWLFETPEFDRRYDLAWMGDYLGPPALACAAYFAATGWVVFALRGRFPFTLAFVLIVAASMATSVVLAAVVPHPQQRLKGDLRPVPVAAWLVLLGPPIGWAAVLTCWGVPARGEPLDRGKPALGPRDMAS